MTEPARPVLRSEVASPEELLGRVRRRLAAEAEVVGPPPADPVFDLLRDEGLLDGWYHGERAGDIVHRWTQRHFDFEAEVRDASHVALDALLFPESGLAELRGRMTANGVPTTGFRLVPGLNRCLVPIPAGLRGRVHFRVDAGGSWCPARAGVSPDERELSINVRRLALERFVPEGAASGGVASSDAAVSPKALRIARRLLASLSVFRRLSEAERRLAELERRVALLAETDRELSAELTRRVDEAREDLEVKLLAIRPD